MTDDRGRQAFIDWARRTAIPIATCEPESGFDDLVPLLAWFGQAKVVALGEATHGTREFFQLKHRLVELLAFNGGVDQFQIEASLPDALAVDDWIRQGRGSASSALSRMRFWTWDTEEVLALIEWMRRVGQGLGPIDFVGYDAQFAASGARLLHCWLIQLGNPSASALAVALEPVLDDISVSALRDADRERLDDILTTVGLIRSHAAELAVVCPHPNPQLTVELVADSVSQAVRMYGADDIWGTRRSRDRAMAENIAAWARVSNRSVVWAHNVHVARDGFDGRFTSMGGHLDELLGDGGQVIVGLVFDRGGFQASDPRRGTLRDVEVASLGGDSIDAALAEVGIPIFAIDLRSIDDPVAQGWVSQPRATRSVGSGYPSDNGGFHHWDVTGQFDVLVFVQQTTPARRTSGGRRRSVPHVRPSPQVSNVDLSAGLDGWYDDESRERAGYRSQLVEDPDLGPAMQFLRLHPEVETGRGVRFQEVEVGEMAARTVTLSALGRVEPAGPGAGVRLWLRAEGPTGRSAVGAPLEATGRIEPMTVEMAVPPDAERLRFGVAFSGPRPATVGRFSLEVKQR